MPFFGQPAASNVATSRLAKISGAPVLPYFPKRRADNRGYVVHIHPPLDNFPVRRSDRRHAPLSRADRGTRARPSGAVPLDVQALQAPGTRRRPVPAHEQRRATAPPLLADLARARRPARVRAAALCHCSSGSAGASASRSCACRSAFVRIARRNLELCLPELPAAEREAMLREHFRSLGVGIFETAISWWSSDERIRKLTRLEGEEHLQAALARGRGAILLSAHFTTLEIGARALCGAHADEHHVSADEQCRARTLPDAQSRPAGEARDPARRHPHADHRAEEQRTRVVCAGSELSQERRGDGAVLRHLPPRRTRRLRAWRA